MLGRMIGAARLNVETYEDVEHDSGATLAGNVGRGSRIHRQRRRPTT